MDIVVRKLANVTLRIANWCFMKGLAVKSGYRFPETSFTAISDAWREGNPRTTWIWVRCDCGTEKSIRVNSVTSGNKSKHIRSCGCFREKLCIERTEKTLNSIRMCACGAEVKPRKSLLTNGSKRLYLSKRCSTCQHNLACHNVDTEEVKILLEYQSYKCLGCGVAVSFSDCIDHKHEMPCGTEHLRKSQVSCKKCIRGILCVKCNNKEAVVKRTLDLSNEEFEFWKNYVNNPSFPLIKVL